MEYEVIFTMKNGETVCVKMDQKTVNDLYEVFKELKHIRGKVPLKFGGKLIDLKEVDYFRWYVI
nr:MAG TPA: chemokine receptor [Caudoviricetes sp.]